MAALQKQLELAMGNGVKFNNAIYVNDRGSMDPDESHWIEIARKFVQCGPVKQLFTAGMKVHVVDRRPA